MAAPAEMGDVRWGGRVFGAAAHRSLGDEGWYEARRAGACEGGERGRQGPEGERERERGRDKRALRERDVPGVDEAVYKRAKGDGARYGDGRYGEREGWPRYGDEDRYARDVWRHREEREQARNGRHDERDERRHDWDSGRRGFPRGDGRVDQLPLQAPPRAKGGSREFRLVLDVNGTLAARKKGNIQARRPHLDAFLDFVLAHFDVVVWTSMIKNNPEALVRRLVGSERHAQMSGVLDGTVCAFVNRTMCKDLRVLWDVSVDFGPHNTVLIDDSPHKGSLNPANLLHVPTFSTKTDPDESHLLRLIAYLDAHFVQQRPRDARDILSKHPFC